MKITKMYSRLFEQLFMEMANKLVSDGYRDVGYTYINIDDCWMSKFRDETGKLVADPVRFPRGISFLADYMHSRGLRLGIYQSFGRRTCMGYPGIAGHIDQDVKTFADWKVDMVKLDACNSNPRAMDKGYVAIGKYLNNTGRPMVYSCSWPYYQLLANMEPDYKLIAHKCNMWRIYDDIHDSWKSIEKVIDFFGDNQDVLSPHIGPGHWSDPDMLMIGNPRLTVGQARAQMAVWAMIPGPLLMSNDLRDIHVEFQKILLNTKVIAINQDSLGLPGKRIFKKNHLEIWKRPIQPVGNNATSFAVLILSRYPYKFGAVATTIHLAEIGLKNEMGYLVTDLFSNFDMGHFYPNNSLRVSVPSVDVIMLTFKLHINS
ncbi:alpha-N-acetylgalactosaminidase-like isoform X1 [Stegodyphus dumicola]|uniref:alpha-N-acetylgalactosaminidase-like isoform X1 n=1 Tax=Stegodyphus dumicola TaxID=202533 RepID=UPI0015AC228A|nr:alpha-N-acetylgalactosaminidase-like isoform X1 [Stegodyphus dumicola]